MNILLFMASTNYAVKLFISLSPVDYSAHAAVPTDFLGDPILIFL